MFLKSATNLVVRLPEHVELSFGFILCFIFLCRSWLHPPHLDRVHHLTHLSLQEWNTKQGAGGRWRREEGVLGFFSKIFKLGWKLSSAITFAFPNLKFSLSVILRVLSVLEEGSDDPKVLAMLDKIKFR